MVDWRWQMFGWRCHILCCASDIHIGAYFPSILRSLVVVGLCGYPWSWLLRCLIDVNRWLIDVDKCLVGNVIFFVVYQISTLGHFSPFSEILSRGWVVWLFLILIIEMFNWCYQVIDWRWQMFGWRCHVVYQIPILGHISSLLWDP